MAKVVFEELIDFTTVETPLIGYLIGYDIADGILKQKDKFGVVTPIGAGAVTISPSPLDVVLSEGNNTGLYDIIMDSSTKITSSNGSGKLELDKLTDVASLSTSNSEVELGINSVNISNSDSVLTIGDDSSLQISDTNKYSKLDQNVDSLNVSFNNDLLTGVKTVTTIDTGVNYIAGSNNITYLHLNTQGSTTNTNIKNSVIIGGTGLVSSSNNTVYVKNLETQGGLSKYSVDPSIISGFDDLTMITKGYVDLSTASIYTYIDSVTASIYTYIDNNSFNLTADNGLNILNDVVELGGTLNKDTIINGDDKQFTLGQPTSRLSNYNINGVVKTEVYTTTGLGSITTQYTPNAMTNVASDSTNNLNTNKLFTPTQEKTNITDGNLFNEAFYDLGSTQFQSVAINNTTGQNSSFDISINNSNFTHNDGSGVSNGVYLSDNNIVLTMSDGVNDSGVVLNTKLNKLYTSENNVEIVSFDLTDIDVTFTDSRTTTKGIEYSTDYSSGYTSLSLITKGDLDSATSSIYTYVDNISFGTTFNDGNGISIDSSSNINLGGTVSQTKTILLPDGVGSKTFRFGDADGTGSIIPFTRVDTLTNQGLLHIDTLGPTQPVSYTFQDDSIYIKKYAQQSGNINLNSNPDSTFVNLGYQSTDSINLFLRTIYDTPGSTVAKSEFSQSSTGFVFDSTTSDPYTTRFSISSGAISSFVSDVNGTGSVIFGSKIMRVLTTDSSGLSVTGDEANILGGSSYIRIDDTSTGDNIISDGSTNLRGLRYVGFGETDVNGSSANYSTLVGTSLVPKKYVDDKVVSSVDYKGGYDASTLGPNSSSLVGNMYTVTVSGDGGGYFTKTLEIGDVIISEIDNPSSETDWTVVNKDLDASSIKVSYESNIDTNAYTDSEKTKIGFIDVSQSVDLDIMESDILLNNIKVSNVTTNLSIGNKNSTTLDVLSSDGTNATIPSVTNLEAGLSTASDKTKLDGIEPLADVTNTTNVTNSGALMDSEITNLTQVKSFDSSDYATSAQGILATNALPKSGGTMTGDINLLDDVRLNVGNSSDLQIYHDSVAGSSIIEDSGSGNLILLSNGPDGILLGKGPTSSYERMIRALPDNGVEIFFDDVKKLETNNTGIEVTGDVTLTGLVDGRDVSTDGLKLDGIEPLADVTLNSISAGTNITISAGGVISATFGSSGVTELDDLSDVTTNFPVSPTQADDGKMLFYDYDLDKWVTDDTVTHGTSIINGKKSTAGTITKGTPVYLVGFDADLHTVEEANSNSISTMPCIGLAAEDIDDTNSKHIITFGKLTGVDTSSFTQNDILYVDKISGGLTTTRPTGSSSQIQRIAKVLKVSVNGGQLFVFNTARTAGLPNVTSNKIWIGDVDSIPEEIEIGKGLNVSGGNLISRPTDNTQTSVSTLTPDSDINDQETITGLSTNLTINTPTGTPTNGQKLILRIKDDGTPRLLSWNIIYEVIGVTLPTTTNANKKMYIGCIYNSTDSTWDVVAINEEA